MPVTDISLGALVLLEGTWCFFGRRLQDSAHMPDIIVAGIVVPGKRLAELFVVGNGTSRDAKQLHSGLNVWQSFYERRARQTERRLWRQPGYQHQVRSS